MTLSRHKRKRLLLLLAYVFFACIAVLSIRPYYFYSILITLGPPTVANFVWVKKSRWKIFLFSLLSSLLFAPAVELSARLANAWDVQSVFPRPFGLIPIENMVFAFINFFWVTSFYTYFMGEDKTNQISTRIKYLTAMYVLFSTGVYGLYFYNRSLIALNYSTLAILILVIPSLLIFGRYPQLIKRTIFPTLFFAVVFFTYEMVSLQIGSWWWPGEYIYSFKINGKVFPLDDVVIWYFFSTPVLIGGYEFFVNGYKQYPTEGR